MRFRSAWVLRAAKGVIWGAVMGAVMGSAVLWPLSAQARLRAPIPANNGALSLPYQSQDALGNTWMVMQSGLFQMQGNMPLYSQGGMLMIAGQQAQQTNNEARVDPATNELIFENLTVSDVMFTRRVKLDTDTGMVRMIDIFKNSTAKEQRIDFVVQSQFNYNPAGSTTDDPRKKGRPLGWVGTTPNQGWRSIVEVYNGKRSRLNMTAGFSKGDNSVSASYVIPLAPGQEAAVMHLHGTVATTTAGTEFINSLDERKLMKDIPKSIRKLIVNFSASNEPVVANLDLLRGDVFDVIELTSGDQFKGTLKEAAYKLNTANGPVELPEKNVVAMFNVGKFKPRQLLVTTDGQIIGGELAKPTIDLVLSSGQLTKVPLSQITRLGYRKRAGETDEWSFNKPFVAFRNGERLFVKLPDAPVKFVSRYGALLIDPKSISSVNLQPETHGVHELTLTDGSVLVGLLAGEQIKLAREGSEELVGLEISKLLQWHFKPVDETEDQTPLMETNTGDQFTGTISGVVNVETAFDALQISGEQIAHMERLKESATDVQVRLWDGAVVNGRLVEADVPLALASGLSLKVPLGVLKEYTHPAPRPSATMLEQIKATVVKLNADDFQERDQAEQQLAAIGSAIAPVLKELRAAQPAESQQRIDKILKSFETGGAAENSGANAAVQQPVPLPALDVQIIAPEAVQLPAPEPAPAP